MQLYNGCQTGCAGFDPAACAGPRHGHYSSHAQASALGRALQRQHSRVQIPKRAVVPPATPLHCALTFAGNSRPRAAALAPAHRPPRRLPSAQSLERWHPAIAAASPHLPRSNGAPPPASVRPHRATTRMGTTPLSPRPAVEASGRREDGGGGDRPVEACMITGKGLVGSQSSQTAGQARRQSNIFMYRGLLPPAGGRRRARPTGTGAARALLPAPAARAGAPRCGRRGPHLGRGPGSFKRAVFTISSYYIYPRNGAPACPMQSRIERHGHH